MQDIPHIPVLYREVIDAFSEIQEGVIIDCTMGYAGHSSMILESNAKIKLIGIDQDQTAIDFSSKRLAPFTGHFEIYKGRFSSVIEKVIQNEDVQKIKGVLADIGVSSLQLDQMDRGFSYESDVLDMRMDPEAPLSAADVVNGYSQSELERILREYGEIRNYKKIASVIMQKRPFSSSKELSDAVKPYAPRGKKIHPATLVMQAIRIEVNDELGELQRLLDAIEASKLHTAYIAIISFHSLEDRIVKQRFSKWAKNCLCSSEAMRCTCGNNNALGRVISKKPIMAKSDELKKNPRSRSAKMRIFKMERSYE
ncbi:MAG: 16S rRNA (cytosine(1402)-N(4))-methyltransferase RsmH [Campylobacterota bacterium]|nr:16S rRNA (cytosine(1402)-N(4))-methyltransferase RsmH [Campylobacterota bacterium]